MSFWSFTSRRPLPDTPVVGGGTRFPADVHHLVRHLRRAVPTNATACSPRSRAVLETRSPRAWLRPCAADLPAIRAGQLAGHHRGVMSTEERCSQIERPESRRFLVARAVTTAFEPPLRGRIRCAALFAQAFAGKWRRRLERMLPALDFALYRRSRILVRSYQPSVRVTLRQQVLLRSPVSLARHERVSRRQFHRHHDRARSRRRHHRACFLSGPSALSSHRRCSCLPMHYARASATLAVQHSTSGVGLPGCWSDRTGVRPLSEGSAREENTPAEFLSAPSGRILFAASPTARVAAPILFLVPSTAPPPRPRTVSVKNPAPLAYPASCAGPRGASSGTFPGVIDRVAAAGSQRRRSGSRTDTSAGKLDHVAVPVARKAGSTQARPLAARPGRLRFAVVPGSCAGHERRDFARP